MPDRPAERRTKLTVERLGGRTTHLDAAGTRAASRRARQPRVPRPPRSCRSPSRCRRSCWARTAGTCSGRPARPGRGRRAARPPTPRTACGRRRPDLHRRDEAVRLEAGGEHDRVGRALAAVRARDSVGVISATRSVTSSTLGWVERGYQSSVSITRLQPSSSLGVTLRSSSGSLIALSICRWAPRRRSRDPRWPVRPARRAPGLEDHLPVEPLQHRVALEQAPAPAREYGWSIFGSVQPGERWYTSTCSTIGWIAGTTWIALQPVPTTATRLPVERHVVAPLGGVEGRAVEAVEPRQRRHRRHRELPAGGEENVGLVVSGARREPPLAASSSQRRR